MDLSVRPSRLLFFLSFACAAGCASLHTGGPAGEAWVSPIGRHHPLAGVVYDVAAARRVGQSDLERAAATADIVLLGEQHDNADHHLLQARVLRAMLEDGRRPAVAFEQIDFEKQSVVDRALADPPASPEESAEALAAAIDWKDSGWPSFELYRPVFETALAAKLPILAANLSRTQLHQSGAVPHCTVDYTPEQKVSLEADIVDSHCGYAGQDLIAPMLDAQKRRDSMMAQVTAASLRHLPSQQASEGVKGVVLVCGFGHARNDYGVPLHLAKLAPTATVLSVAFLEVSEGADDPSDYAAALHADRLPFDYVVFTPRVDDKDPCEKYRKGLEKMKQAAPPEHPQQSTR